MFYLGAGGGGGSWHTNPYGGGRATIQGNDFVGQGAGAAYLFVKTVSGLTVRANGNSGGNSNGNYGGYAGGGGSGGSIKVVYGQGSVSLLEAGGAPGGVGTRAGGGHGGVGRIRVEYCDSYTHNAYPVASTQKLTCYIAEQLESAPYTTGRLNLPAAIAAGNTTTYTIQYGRRVQAVANTPSLTMLRVPAGLFASVSLDALVSGLQAAATLSIDIGDNGSVEWTQPVANNSTNASPNLAAVFNAYWQSQGSPTTGTLDVPVRVVIDGSGQVLLTDLVVTTGGSTLHHVRLASATYSSVLLDLSVDGSAQDEALVLALDVGNDGTLDWTYSQPTDLPAHLQSGNVAAAVNAWFVTHPGETDVPVRIHIAPQHSVTVKGVATTTAATVNLTGSGLHLGDVQAAAEVQAADADVRSGEVVELQATISNGGGKASGPVTVAFFATAEGWGDWYVGSDFVGNIPAGGSVPVSTLWNTTGFSGTVPIKAVVNPYGRVGETNYNDNRVLGSATVALAIEPTALFSVSPTSGNAPLAVQFTDQSTGDITGWSWDFGDGGSATQQHPQHTYTTAGIYNVTLAVTGPGGTDTLVRSALVVVDEPSSTGLPVLAVSPAVVTAGVGMRFSVDLVVRTDASVDAASAYLDFDPATLQVASITPGTALATILQNQFDNVAGRLDFAAGSFTTLPQSDFVLATVSFTATAITGGTQLAYGSVHPRRSDVTLAGLSTLHHVEPGSVTVVQNVASLTGQITPPGRLPDRPAPHADWRIPLTVTLSPPAGGAPLFTFTPTSDDFGRFTIAGIPPGSYRIGVKSGNTLRVTTSQTLVNGANNIDFGLLPPGDADNDNNVTVIDFSILRTTFGKCTGTAGYDARADFDGSGCVLIVDFSLLRTRFGAAGDAAASAAQPDSALLPSDASVAQSAALLLDAPAAPLAVGEVISVSVRIAPPTGGSIDAAALYLDVDPAAVELLTVTTGAALPLLLQSEVDAGGGHLNFAAGTLEAALDTPFVLAVVTLRLLRPGAATLMPVHMLPRRTEVTSGGQPLTLDAPILTLDVTAPGAPDPEPMQRPMFLPYIANP